MSIFVWNCQGAAANKFHSVLKSFIRDHRPHVVALVEPRISGITADKVIRKIGYAYSHRVEANGFSGGIWLLWTDAVEVEVITNHSQFIHSKITLKSDLQSFFFTAVYAHPNSHIRQRVWSDLTRTSYFNSAPLLLAGDFNATLSSTERRGGSEKRRKGCPHFQAFCNNNNLVDLGYSGPHFTWRRGLTFARLDRALSNTAWIHTFPNSKILHLAQINSDHRPLLIELGTSHRSGNSTKPFRFLAAWANNDSFPQLVKDNWSNEISLKENINQFTQAASLWNNEVFGLIGKQKHQLQKRIMRIQRDLERSPTSPHLIDLEESLRLEFETTCLNEELL
ncbi:uncharacterized protein LOC114748407 [Neltuma alba]|uniref:uncharacterized protein LOC114748407 n=1 Tax=Neltuma alba TaxID=207710 RepID=UPI0010A3EA9F|nr:uncharacterized protein LOC114748407 [Prosopis alba]